MSTLLISMLVVPTTTFANDQTSASNKNEIAISQFTDVKPNHWAYDSIQWAHQRKIVSGYGNGRFGPNDDVSEAQFVTMVANYLGLKADYGLIDNSKKGGPHWSDDRYNAIAQYGVPLNGYFDNKIRNQPMKRGLVAQALTHLVGYETDLRGSIDFLLDNNITTGQNPQFKDKDLYKFFGTTNTLSRSQIVVFLHRLETENLNTLSQTIEQPNGQKIDVIAENGKKRVDSNLSQGKTPPVSEGNNGGGWTQNNDGSCTSSSGLTFYTNCENIINPSKPKPTTNKVSGRFKNNIKEGYVTSINGDNTFIIRDPNKDGFEGSVFVYNVFNDNTEMITTFYEIYEKDRKYIASLVLNAGFNLTEAEIIQNIDKAIKDRGKGSHTYKGYTFLFEGFGYVSIKNFY